MQLGFFAGAALGTLAAPATAVAASLSLTGALQTGDFANVAVAETVPSGAAGTAAASTLVVHYDAASKTYTISNATAGRSQSFGPNTQQTDTGSLITYRKTDGGTTDTLVLTHPTAFGKGGYQWVGAGLWRRARTGATGTVDAFAYGVQTDAAAVPRTGTGYYGLTLQGTGAWERGATSATGYGAMTADFAKGTVAGTGQADATDAATGSWVDRYDWSFTGSIGSTARAVGGTFALTTGNGSTTGPLRGWFYGPTAQEFGATVIGRGTSHQGAGVFAGVLLGSQTRYDNFATSLTALRGDQSFGTLSTFARSDFAPDGHYVRSYTNNDGISIDYKAATGLFVVRDTFNDTVLARTAALTSARLTNTRFLGYAAKAPLYGGTLRTDLQLFRRGADNPQIALTYTSFAHLFSTFTSATNDVEKIDQWMLFGLPTESGNTPRTGTATYTGVLYGSAVVDGHGVRTPGYDVVGTAQFTADFSAQVLTGGTLKPVLVDASGVRKSLGTLTMGRNEITSVGYPGSDTKLGVGAYAGVDGDLAQGDVNLLFYGPKANELGGTFSLSYALPVAGFGGTAQGMIVTRR